MIKKSFEIITRTKGVLSGKSGLLVEWLGYTIPLSFTKALLETSKKSGDTISDNPTLLFLLCLLATNY